MNATLRAGLAAASLLVLSALSPAFAQAPASETPSAEQIKAARDVIDVSGAAASIKDIVPIFLDEAKNTLTRTRPEIANDLNEAIKTVEPEFLQRKEDLMNDIATVYAQRFSAQELTEIKAFYTSETGKKLVQNLPGVLQASYERTQVWSQRMSTDIIGRLRQEMKKRGVDL